MRRRRREESTGPCRALPSRHVRDVVVFDPLDREQHAWIGEAMGAFDGAPHTRLVKHIFMAEKGDDYDVADGLPQQER